jgi:hypothetical protein
MSHPGGGLTKDYNGGNDTAFECMSHPGGGLTKDHHDGYYSSSISDCVSHPGGGLTKGSHLTFPRKTQFLSIGKFVKRNRRFPPPQLILGLYPESESSRVVS